MALDIDDGDGAHALDAQQVSDRWQASVVSGVDVSPGTNDLTVSCSSGTVIVDGSEVSVSAQDNVSLTSADANDPRKDTVYIDGSGTLTVSTGTAEVALPAGQSRADTYRPAPPVVTAATGTVVAEVWVPAGVSDIASGDVRDRRLFAALDAGDVTTDATTTDELRVQEGRGILGLPNHHTQYADGLSDEELTRFTLAAGDVLEVWRLEAALKGGGTDGDVSVDVYDASDSTVLASTTGGSRTEGGSSPLGTSTAGATILIRLSTPASGTPALSMTGQTAVVGQ